MKHRSLITGLIGTISLLISAPVSAHDFWMSPQNYHPKANQSVDVKFRIGHAEDQEEWAIKIDRVVGFRSLSAHGMKDLQPSISKYRLGKGTTIGTQSPGLNIIALETTQSRSDLPADKFNSYIEEEGLRNYIVQRKARQQDNMRGREVYSRRAKSLLQIGAPSETDDKHAATPIGHTLEIVPLVNPYNLSKGETLKAKIMYRGSPRSGVKVNLGDIATNAGIVSTHISDKNGIVEFKMPGEGEWMLHAVWGDVLEGRNDAEFTTIFSSLSFAVP